MSWYRDRMPKKDILAGVDCDWSKIIARNTVVYTQGGLKRYRYYRTDILKQTDAGWEIGGHNWPSRSTCGRLNYAFRLEKLPLAAWMITGGIYIRSSSQMIPLTGPLFWENNNLGPEQSSWTDADMRRGLCSISNQNPLTTKWDGRASTLRSIMYGWRGAIPQKLLRMVPGAKIVISQSVWNCDQTLRLKYRITKGKIKLRDLFEDICRKGGI